MPGEKKGDLIMGNNKICPIHIQDGTDLNAVFLQWQKKQRTIEEQPTKRSDKKEDTVEIQSCVSILPYVKPIYAEVEKNELMVSILQKITPIDFHEMFARRKSNASERNARFTLIWDLRDKIDDSKNAYKIWGLLNEMNKLKAPLTKAVIYVIESLMYEADRVGSGILSKNNIIYMYNGKMWEKVDPTLMMAFVEMAAMRCGMDVDDVLSAKFRSIFIAQLHNTAEFLETIDNEKDVTINLRNGIMRYDGSKVTLEPHYKESYFTYCLDFDFDTNAECPKFHKYLDRVLPDKEQQALLQEYLGYCLSGLFLKHEKAMMLYGPMGSGGKSVLHDTLEGIFKGQLMSNYSLSEISQPLHRYNMQDRLINYSSEIDFSKANMEVFKQLCSCETVSARKLFHMPIEVKIKSKLMFNANSLPDIDLSESVFRRLIILPFTQVITPAEANINLAKELVQEESSGIFNWMVAGLERLTSRGRFDIPFSVQKVVNQYKKDSVNVNVFLDEMGWEKSQEVGDKVLLMQLYKKYSEFTSTFGYRRFNLQNFSAHLRKMGFIIRKSNQNKTYVWCKQTVDPDELTSKTLI